MLFGAPCELELSRDMATKILQIELKKPAHEVGGLEDYDKVLVFLRYGGRPVGQFQLPVVDGRLNDAELHDMIFHTDHWAIWERIVHEYLDWEAEDSPPYRPSATVAAITRDRVEDLKRCLDSLMLLPDDGQEILVVDNCPRTDASRRLVDGYGGRVRYVREDRPGSSAARNRALREARHEIVAFIDDDAVADAGWLRALVRNFRDPRVLAVTGLVAPLELETRAQEQFEEYTPHGRGFRRQVFSQENHYALHVAPAGVSANMALRRDSPDLIGPFDEALGVGTPARCGEDHELFTRILTAGYHIVYEPAALNWHRHRRTWPELRSAVFGYGVGVYAYWTRLLLVGFEPSVLLMAWRWFMNKQFPAIIRSVLRRRGHTPLDILLAELLGCATGPWAYFKSRRSLRARGSAP